MNVRHFPFAFLVLSLLLSGCAPSPESKLIGSWQGKFVLDESTLQQPQSNNPLAQAAAGAMQGLAKSLAANLSADYDFREDKTFTMTTQMGSVSGSWEVISSNGNAMTVRMHPENRAAIEYPITFTSADQFEHKVDQGTVVFTKKAS